MSLPSFFDVFLLRTSFLWAFMGVYLGILREENINKKALWGYIGGLYEVFMGINKDFG